METVGKADELDMPKITIRNNREMIGRIQVVMPDDRIVIDQEFNTRAMRRELTDLIMTAYYDKIHFRGWAVQILIDKL